MVAWLAWLPRAVLWDVITYPCLRYLLLAPKSSYLLLCVHGGMASKGCSVGCNYLSLPEIPASGTHVFILVAMCTWWHGFDGFQGLQRCPGIISTVSSLQECGWQWQWKTKPCHNVPGHGRNQPDADSIGLILAMFWHTMLCLWVRQQGCYQKLQVNDYRAVARGLFH